MNAGEISFGRFRLDLQGHRLSCEDEPIRLPGRALDILCVLAAARGAIVSKDELMQRLWPGRAVEENNLHVHVSNLRKALNGNRGESHVMTVPSRGYRLVGMQSPPSLNRPERPVLRLPEKPSVAVLPFLNKSGDPDQEYLVDGITEDIITALAKWRWFFVTARNSSFTYKGRAVDVKQVGREMGVRYVLEGSVRNSGDRVRISAQLIDAESGNHVWAENFDTEFGGVPAVQDELTQKIAAAIEPAIVKLETHRARYKRGDDLAAWDHYLHGLWHVNQQTAADAVTALWYFEKALALDENLSEAYVGIARAYHTQYGYGFASDRAAINAKAEEVARLALARDNENCYAHYVLALTAAHAGDPETAIRASKRAIELNPSFSPGYFSLAVGSIYRGETEAALAAIDAALRLSPNDPQLYVWLALRGSALYLLGNYEEAIAAAEESRGLRWFYTSIRVLAASYAQIGELLLARAAVDELLAAERSERTIAEVICRFKRAADREHYAAGLRKAGLPEA
jgi:adenylate cyclase